MNKRPKSVITFTKIYSRVLHYMKKNIKDGTYNGTPIDEFYQTLVEARATEVEKDGSYPRPSNIEKEGRNQRLCWQHIHFIRQHKLAIHFREFVAFHAYLTACMIVGFCMTNKIKTIQEYFEQWINFERDIFYKEPNGDKMTIVEM